MMLPRVAIASSAALSAPSSPAPSEQKIHCNFSVPARGDVTVTFSTRVDQDPRAYGLDLLFPTISLDNFSGFPVCEGTVTTAKKGYASIYGWTQLWKQNDSDWQFDWAPVETNLSWPFVWFGPQAQLFDGPTRVGVADLDWTARSFLTYIDDSLMTRSVRCVVGFEWGFWIQNGRIVVKALNQLQTTDWDMHVEYLSVTFPEWKFNASQ